MKNRFVYLFSQLALFGGFCFFSLAEVQNPHEKHLSNNNLKNEIHRILKTSSVPLKNFGLVVSPVLPSDEEFYFSHNENKLFIPASLSKIVVASAVLHYFSPFHQFETLFLSDSFVKNGQLSGSLYMKGGGDPSFVSESLWILVNTLRRLGLKKVDGDLVLDHFLFNRSLGKKKWFGDVDRSFNTPLSALSFNWNSVAVRIRPGLKENDPAYIFSDLENSYIQLSNKTKTKGLKKNIHFSRKKRSSSKGDHILVQGSVPLNEPEFVVYRNVSDRFFGLEAM